MPPTCGPSTSSCASKVPVVAAKLTRASSKASQRLVSGNQALKTLSLALKSNRSQQTPSAAPARSHCSSSGTAICSRMPCGSGSSTSASMPIVAISSARATAAAQYPEQCVMLPTKPSGQRGSRCEPGRTGCGDCPSADSARRAQLRPAAYSARRLGTAAPSASRSSGSIGSWTSPAAASTTATTAGNNISITSCGADEAARRLPRRSQPALPGEVLVGQHGAECLECDGKLIGSCEPRPALSDVVLRHRRELDAGQP